MIFINGDYSRDQILPEHVAKINPLIKLDQAFTTFNSYTSGNVGSGIDTSNSSTVFSLPSPYSYHHVFFSNLIDCISAEFSCQ